MEDSVRAASGKGEHKWRRVERMIGAEKFAQLLILKARQIGLVDVNEDVTGNTFYEHYSLVIGDQARV
jgi:hypothetical protein